MTDDERALLHDTAARTAEIHRALFSPSADGHPPMFERIATVVVAAERGSWGVKWTMRILIGVGAIIGTIAGFKGLIPK